MCDSGSDENGQAAPTSSKPEDKTCQQIFQDISENFDKLHKYLIRCKEAETALEPELVELGTLIFSATYALIMIAKTKTTNEKVKDRLARVERRLNYLGADAFKKIDMSKESWERQLFLDSIKLIRCCAEGALAHY